MDAAPVVSIKGKLFTTHAGIQKLFRFYHECSGYQDITIFIDFYKLEWFDGNLSAILGSILIKLIKENNLKFSTDFVYLKEKFNVLFKNGFLLSEMVVLDDRKSTVVYQQFGINDKEEFLSYVENDLMSHQGMPNIEEDQKEKIIDALIEVFNNIQIHSKTQHGFFVCGQYYPRKRKLVFTMLDLGVGFLPAIQQKTQGQISNDYDSIHWAIQKSNTTKPCSPGGLGLFDLYSYFKSSSGDMQIITGDTFWSITTDAPTGKRYTYSVPYFGSILNLFFSI